MQHQVCQGWEYLQQCKTLSILYGRQKKESTMQKKCQLPMIFGEKRKDIAAEERKRKKRIELTFTPVIFSLERFWCTLVQLFGSTEQNGSISIPMRFLTSTMVWSGILTRFADSILVRSTTTLCQYSIRDGKVTICRTTINDIHAIGRWA